MGNQKTAHGRMLPGLYVARVKSGLTQAELAGRAGISRDTLSSLELGKQGARAVTIKRLSEALGVSPTVLMRDPDDGAVAA